MDWLAEARTDEVEGGGCRLRWLEVGPAPAPAILFLHGFSQSALAFCAQLAAGAPAGRRLVAADLRGHGRSDKPAEAAAYRDPALWAADVAALVAACGPAPPVVVAWSYGARVVMDYLALHGDAALAGLVLVGARLSTAPEHSDAEAGALIAAMGADDPRISVPAAVDFMHRCTAAPLPAPMFARQLAASMLTPVAVRRALTNRPLDAAPLLAGLTRPLMLVHGSDDRVVPASGSDWALAQVPRGRGCLVRLPGVGHAPFLEVPERFDPALAEFCAGLPA